MKYINKRIKISLLLAIAAVMFLASCNKDPYIPLKDPSPTQQPTPTLATLLDDPTFSIFKAAVVKAGLIPTLSAASLRFTMFIPNDAAMTASGLSLGVINAIPAASVTALVSYHIIPQVIASTSIPTFFPNFAYPTIYNPAPSLSPFLRLTTSPSNRNGFWLNNVPIVQLDIPAVNGVAHRIALATGPPSRYLWDRINTDADLTIFRAAILRADSGVVTTSTSGGLVFALSSIGANLTVFAPGNQQFRNLFGPATGLPLNNYVSAPGATNVGTTVTVSSTTGLLPGMAVTVTSGTGAFAPGTVVASVTNATTFVVSAVPATNLSGGAVVTGNPDPLYAGFLGSASISTQTVKGIAAYHILGLGRAFLNNFPTTATAYPTLLNGGIPGHPGVTLKVTFTGPTTITSATVKGVVNPVAANIAINPTPDPNGTSDQHFINGVLHKIDQVLLPQ